jgi:hypothetical protein
MVITMLPMFTLNSGSLPWLSRMLLLPNLQQPIALQRGELVHAVS